jgi:hypothetical protein
MVLCIVAAVVLGIVSIFSARYRTYAKEAFRCVFRMATLRKCDTDFDRKMKSAVVGRLITRLPKFAGFVYRQFAIISWVFTIIFFVSLAYTGYSVYNLAVYNNCNGPGGGACVFVQNAQNETNCVAGDVPVSPPVYFDLNASVMFFYRDGCQWCTKEKEVLADLSKSGYTINPMHIDAHPEYINQYNIEVTPTFIGKNGTRLEGYQEEDVLKAFLDANK